MMGEDQMMINAIERAERLDELADAGDLNIQITPADARVLAAMMRHYAYSNGMTPERMAIYASAQ